MKTPQTWGLVWDDDFDHWTIAPQPNGGFVQLADFKAMQSRIELLERQVDTAHRQIERLEEAGEGMAGALLTHYTVSHFVDAWDAAKEGRDAP